MKRFLALSALALGISAFALNSTDAGPIVKSGNASARGGNGGNAKGWFAKAGNGGFAGAAAGNIKSKGFFSSVVNSGNATAIGGNGPRPSEATSPPAASSPA